MINADCVLSRFRHRSKCLHVCTHLILPATVEKNIIIIVHFIDEKTEEKND